MPEASLDLDFLTLAWWWNLVGLPAVVAVVAGRALGKRRHEFHRGDIAVAIRRLAIVHVILGLRAAIALVQELLTLREMGIPQSFPVTGIIWPFLTIIVDLALARGLWRRSPSARRWAVGWQALQAAVVVPVCFFLWRYGVPIEPADWPDLLVSKGFPFLILGLLLDRAMARAFARGETAQEGQDRPVIFLVTLWLVIIAGSTLAVDLADWLFRLVQG